MLSERSEQAAHPHSSSPTADAVSMPGPSKASAGSRLAKQTSAGTNEAATSAESALGSAPAEGPDLKEGPVPVQAMAAKSTQEMAEPAAQDEPSAASAAAVGKAPPGEQHTRKGLVPDEAKSLPSIQEKAVAPAQNNAIAESAYAAGNAFAVTREPAEGLMPNEAEALQSIQEKAGAAAQAEGAAETATVADNTIAGQQDTENVLMPDDAKAHQSMQENAKAAAQTEALAESADTAENAPPGKGAEEGLMPDEALAAVSTDLQAQAATQTKGVTQSAASPSSAAAKEQDSQEAPMLDEEQAPVRTQETSEAATHDEGGAASAGRTETMCASAQASPVQLQPEGLPVPSMQEAAEAVTQSAVMPQVDVAQISSHALELPEHSEPTASVSRKRERPTDLEKLEETEKPGRGSGTRLGNPAHAAESAQGRSALLAECADQSPDVSCQTAAAIAGDPLPAAPKSMHAEAQVSAAESHEVLQDFSGQAEVSSSGTPASPAIPLAALDAQAASAPGAAEVHKEPADALRKINDAEAMGQASSTAGITPRERDAGSTPDAHAQDSQPLPQAAEGTCSPTGSESITQVPTHAIAARKLASAELLCDEVLPEADFGMPWHGLAEAAPDGQGHHKSTPDQRAKANARSRLGQPLPSSHAHDSAQMEAASAETLAATEETGNVEALQTHEPVAEQFAPDGTAAAEEAGAALNAVHIAPRSAQQEAQLLSQRAEALYAAPEEDADGQPGIGQPVGASKSSPRIAAALLEAGSRITVRATKPRRATVDAHSSAAAPPEAVPDPLSALPIGEAAAAAGNTEPVKAPNPIKVRKAQKSQALMALCIHLGALECDHGPDTSLMLE